MKNPLFRTPVTIPKQKPVPPDSNWFSMGSCFAKEIALKLSQSGLKIFSNPSGILFNPISISNTMLRLLEQNLYKKRDLQKVGDQYFEWGHHGSFRKKSSEELLTSVNDAVVTGRFKLRTSDMVIITWGSAIVYKLKATGQIVGNCHKQPNNLFDRELLEIDEIVNTYSKLYETLLMYNPDIRIIMTVSPVRYVKDGFVENQISKSVLFIALNKLIQLFPGHISYFPAYEIMMDELRDYRFYKNDMIHPDEVAIELIWQYFKQTYFSESSLLILEEIDKYNKMVQHKPLFPDSSASKELEKKIEQMKIQLEDKYPFLNI